MRDAGKEACVPTIRLVTQIDAPVERCFDLARSVDAHTDSTAQTRERAVGGITAGLLECGDVVTWEAVHFGVRQRLTVRITELDWPHRFVDELVRGAFRELRHVHEFAERDGGTRMVDTFAFESPFGPVGQLVNALVLTRYMRAFLRVRNTYLKRVAEAGHT